MVVVSAKHYLNLPKPECEMSMLDISNDIFQYEHPRIPLGFGTNLQPFRFLHWFINPKLTPKFVENHIYLYDYIKHQLPSPRLARAWDAIEARHHNNSLQGCYYSLFNMLHLCFSELHMIALISFSYVFLVFFERKAGGGSSRRSV